MGRFVVKCCLCGQLIGTRDEFLLGEENDGFSETERNDEYGGEVDGSEYCRDCYEDVKAGRAE
ncbi:hypothetical protein AGMMS49991_11880 [Spirochaetia bacterium]|nr:hypothetical protein AGMMS49991_11880 [Spirochaetia bacterium]